MRTDERVIDEDEEPARTASLFCRTLQQIPLPGRWVPGGHRREDLWAIMQLLWRLLDPAARENLVVALDTRVAQNPDDHHAIAYLREMDESAHHRDIPLTAMLGLLSRLFPDDQRLAFGWTGDAAAEGAELIAWSDADLVERLVGSLFKDGLDFVDDLASVFADEYIGLTATGRGVDLLCSRHGTEWYVLLWPTQLEHWTNPQPPGRGPGDPSGDREPRIPVGPTAHGAAPLPDPGPDPA